MPTPESLKLKKKLSFSEMDNDHMVLYFGITILGSIAIPFVYYSIMVNIYATANQPDGFQFPHIVDFWRVIAGAIGTTLTKSGCTYLFTSSFESSAKGDTDKQRMRYQVKAAENIGQIIYFTIFSVWGFYELRQSNFLPTFMGGHYDGKTAFENTMANNPFNTFPRGVYEWFLFSAGNYFGELVLHVFVNEHKSDFGEMCVHHLATIFLIFGSGYANQVGIGSIISWLHIVSDIPISAARIFSSLKSTFAEYTCGVVLVCGILPSWFYLRCGCLSFLIYNIFTNSTCVYAPPLQDFSIFLQLNGIYLSVLQLLNIYWIILLLKMLVGFLSGKGAEDL